MGTGGGDVMSRAGFDRQGPHGGPGRSAARYRTRRGVPQPRTPLACRRLARREVSKQPSQRLDSEPLTRLGDPAGCPSHSTLGPAFPPGQIVAQPGRDRVRRGHSTPKRDQIRRPAVSTTAPSVTPGTSRDEPGRRTIRATDTSAEGLRLH